mgnify:CR=1 FL=1
MNRYEVELSVDASNYEGDVERMFIQLEVKTELKYNALYHFMETLIHEHQSDEPIEIVADEYEDLMCAITETVFDAVLSETGWDDVDTCVIDDINQIVDNPNMVVETEYNEDEEVVYRYEYPELNRVVTEEGTYINGDLKYAGKFLHPFTVNVLMI